MPVRFAFGQFYKTGHGVLLYQEGVTDLPDCFTIRQKAKLIYFQSKLSTVFLATIFIPASPKF